MQSSSSVTARQLAVYDFITEQLENRGVCVTVREIGEHFGIRSPNGVVCHLKALKRKGLIEWDPGRARTIRPARLCAGNASWVGQPIFATRLTAGNAPPFPHCLSLQDLSLAATDGEGLVGLYVIPGDGLLVRRQNGRLEPIAVIRRVGRLPAGRQRRTRPALARLLSPRIRKPK